MRILTDISLSRPVLPAFLLLGGVFGGYAAYVPDIKLQISASDGDLGTAMLVAAIGAVIAMWLASHLDRLLGRAAIPIMMTAIGLFFFGPTSATGLMGFTLAMICLSSLSGSTDVIINARLSSIETQSGHKLMGLNHAAFSFAYAGSAVGAGVARGAGWSPLDYAWVTFLGVLVLVALTPRTKIQIAKEIEDKATNISVPWAIVLPIGLAIMVAFMTELASEAWSALHIERLLNASAEMAALGPAILGVTMGIGRLIGQYAFERLDELQVVRGGAALSALGAILAAQAMGPWMVYLGFGLLGFGVSVMVPMLFSHVGNVIPEAQRSAAISRVAVIGYIGFFIGPPMMGFLSEWGSLRVSFTAIALMLVCVVIGLRQPRG